MTWPVTLSLSAILLMTTAPTLGTCKDCSAFALAAEDSGLQDDQGSIVVSPLADENASSSYVYRGRTRDTGRDRKVGRSRDERGGRSQRTHIREGVWPRHNSTEPADVDQKERSLEESEEGL